MRLKEQRLWDSWRRNVAPGAWLQRIENRCVNGMPDVYAVGQVGPHCIASWVELKAPIRPKRASTRLLGREGLNQDQINWHLKAWSLDLPSYVLIRDDRGALFLVSGAFAAEINDLTLSQIEEVSMADNWEDINLELGMAGLVL